MNTPQQRKVPILPPIGSSVNWFGTVYKVKGHASPDSIIVTLGNGYDNNLWWPCGNTHRILSKG